MICPKCGIENDDTQKQCQVCGSPLTPESKKINKKTGIIIGVVAVIIIIAIIGIASAIANSSKQESVDDDWNSYSEDYTYTTEYTTIAETTTKKVNLSDSCDKVLASGSYNDDYYELVATQEETYSDVVVKIGVIKNNEWLVPLTTDIPFINEDGRIYTDHYYDHDASYENASSTKNLDNISDDDYHFIGNGCFHIYESRVGDIIYNAELDKELILPKSGGAGVDFYTLHLKKSLDEYICSDKFIVEYYKDSNYQDVRVLDTNTMEMNIIIENPECHDVVGPLSDGLFAMGYDYGSSVNAFYNVDGNKVLDVSEYKIHYTNDTHNEYPYFENGQFKFVTTNEAGTKYDMIIDKTGKVLSNTKQTESN